MVRTEVKISMKKKYSACLYFKLLKNHTLGEISWKRSTYRLKFEHGQLGKCLRKRNDLYENFEKKGGSREKGEEETKSMPHTPVEKWILTILSQKLLRIK